MTKIVVLSVAMETRNRNAVTGLVIIFVKMTTMVTKSTVYFVTMMIAASNNNSVIVVIIIVVVLPTNHSSAVVIPTSAAFPTATHADSHHQTRHLLVLTPHLTCNLVCYHFQNHRLQLILSQALALESNPVEILHAKINLMSTSHLFLARRLRNNSLRTLHRPNHPAMTLHALYNLTLASRRSLNRRL